VKLSRKKLCYLLSQIACTAEQININRRAVTVGKAVNQLHQRFRGSSNQKQLRTKPTKTERITASDGMCI